MAKHGLIIFLAQYAVLSSSNSSYDLQKCRSIEDDFSIAIYDYLEIYRDNCKGNKKRLEEISQEYTFLGEKIETKRMIKEIIGGRHKRLYEDFKHLLLPSP